LLLEEVWKNLPAFAGTVMNGWKFRSMALSLL